MTREEAEKYGKRYAPSYASQYSPWQNQFSAMAKKTCLRKLISTYGYMSVEMQSVIAKDVIANDNEMGVSEPVDQKVIDIEPTKPVFPFDTDTEGKEGEETAPQPQEQKKQEPDF
jgi:recombination protein RecT